MTAAKVALGGLVRPLCPLSPAPRILPVRALRAMATAEDLAASKPSSRVKHTDNDAFETYEAGQSDGQSAGDLIVGFGGMVCPRALLSPTVRNLAEQCVRVCSTSSVTAVPSSRLAAPCGPPCSKSFRSRPCPPSPTHS